jgi:glycosyltransferase involved in cell wall biosynthesis
MVSFIATVFNEEKSIGKLLQSVVDQSRKVDEIIIVDGKSTDNTLSVVSNFKFNLPKNNVKIIVRKGNRSVGRNEAIRNSSNEIILCSDAGCVLDKNWVKRISLPFSNPKVDVVAGYYQGVVETIFQKCLVPYVLVMPDKINVNNFLPATRSMAFKKSVWEKTGKFPEKFSNNEDYIFARKLRKINANIVFKKDAIVYWMPRDSFGDAYAMFYRFAKGDAESHILRPKVIIIFLRYIAGLILLAIYLLTKSNLTINILGLLLFAYVFWSISKNYKYVNNLMAILYLPLIQIMSDIAVIVGTSVGIFQRHNDYNT